MSNYTHVVSKTSLSAMMKKGADSSSSSAPVASRAMPIPAFEAFKAPPIPESKNVKNAIEVFLTLPGVIKSNSIASVTAARGGAVLPDVNRAVVINPRSAMTSGGADRTAIAVMRNEQYGAPIAREFRVNMMNEVLQHYLGQGTAYGMAVRMKEQLQTERPTPPDQEDLEAVIALLPKKYTAQLPSDITLLAADPEFNAKAHPGAPFFVTGVQSSDSDVLAHSVALAAQYFKVLAEDPEGAAALVRLSVTEDHKFNFVTLLAAKMDVMERQHYFTRTRPIGITPFWLRLLESVLTQAFYPAMANFIDDPTSISAFRFSWTHGGITKLVDFVLSPQAKPFMALSWGDDQIWRCQAKNGARFLLFPDVSGMDMKITSRHYKIYRAWLAYLFSDEAVTIDMFEKPGGLESYLENAKIGANWFELMLYHVSSAAKKQVMVDNGVIINMSIGLLSGKSATTIIDFIGSADLVNKVSKVEMPETDSVADIQDYQKRLLAAAKAAGFPLKPSTMTAQRLAQHDLVHLDGKVEKLADTVVIGLPFLGMKVVQFKYRGDYTKSGEDMYVLAPESDASRSVLKTIYTGTTSENSKMASCFGRGYTTFTNPDAFNFQRNLYDQRIKMGMHAVADALFNDPVLGELDLSEIENLATYPEPEYFAWLFMSDDERALVKRPALDNALDVALGKPGAASAEVGDELDDGLAVTRKAAPVAAEDDMAVVRTGLRPPMLRSAITTQQQRSVIEMHDDRPFGPSMPVLNYADKATAKPGMMPSDSVLKAEAEARHMRLLAVRARIKEQRGQGNHHADTQQYLFEMQLLDQHSSAYDDVDDDEIEDLEERMHRLETEWYARMYEERDDSDDETPPPPPDDDVEMSDAEMDSMITPGYSRNTLG